MKIYLRLEAWQLADLYIVIHIVEFFIKSGLYTFKSGNWVTRPILKADEDVYTEPSITKLKAFVWKLYVPYKICHLIWQLITYMYFSKMWGIRWVYNSCYLRMSTTALSLGINLHFLIWIYSQRPSYEIIWIILFCRKNSIVDLEMDKDPYPWIIWYLMINYWEGLIETHLSWSDMHKENVKHGSRQMNELLI